MTLERNERALIALVESACEQRRREILEAARRDADALRRAAHAEARRAMRRAFESERRLSRERIEAAQAHLETRQRAATQQRNTALVAAALQALPAALLARWRAPASREAWIDRAVDAALRALPQGAWRVSHPVGLSVDERARLAAAIVARGGTAPVLVADAGVEAGLAIAADGASIDATLPALIADREDIGARLLDRIARLEASAASAGDAAAHAQGAGVRP